MTPLLTAMLTGKRAESHGEGRFARFFAWVTDGYGRLLELALRRRLAAIGIFILLLVGAVVLFPYLGSEFLPQMDDGRVMVKVKLPSGASLTETNKILSKVEEKLINDPFIESYVTMAGGKVWGLATYEIANEGQVDTVGTAACPKNRH